MTTFLQGSLTPTTMLLRAETGTQRKIRNFLALPAGWHYGSGIAAEKHTVERALAMYDLFILLGLSTTDAFPGIDGEVMVTAYKGDYYIEYIAEVDGTVSVLAEKHGQEIFRCANMSDAQAVRKLFDLAVGIWNTSVSSTRDIITTGDRVVSKALLSAPHREMEWFRSSSARAWTAEANRIGAHTFEGTTRLSGTLPYSGGSTTRFFPQVAA